MRDNPVNPKRMQARSIEWDPNFSGYSSWRAAHKPHRDAEYMAAADQFDRTLKKPLPRRSQPYMGSSRVSTAADCQSAPKLSQSRSSTPTAQFVKASIRLMTERIFLVSRSTR